MMILVACASVGRGPSDARPEHYHGRGPEQVFFCCRAKGVVMVTVGGDMVILKR